MPTKEEICIDAKDGVVIAGETFMIDLQDYPHRVIVAFSSSRDERSPLRSGDFVVELQGGERHRLPLRERLTENAYPFTIVAADEPQRAAIPGVLAGAPVACIKVKRHD
ncbi:MAG: hypothetical protein HND55_02705 [Pseudomonadota bacterium]|nr:MAG: hypothetical protein HND55_02705 [Pseudomonadota bacterium]